MEFRRIEYFLVLAEKLSYVKAAQELCISSQALTKQINILEDELGCKLFDRTTRSVTLTRTGQMCYQHFSYLKNVYDDTLEEVMKNISREKAVVKMAVFAPLPRNELIMPVINCITSEFDDIELDIYACDIGRVKDMLFNGEVDICITNAHDFENWMSCDWFNFKIAPASIVVSRKHKWAQEKKTEITVKDIEDASILLMDTHREMERNSFYRLVKTKARHKANDFETLMMMLETGKDFAVFPYVFNDMDRTNKVFYELPDKYKFNYRTICACRKDNNKPEVRKVMRFLEKHKNDFLK